MEFSLLRIFRQRRAIKQFVKRLPLDLQKRFGEKRHYDLAEVSKVVESGQYDMAFVAFAHALFCSRDDFNAYYEPLRIRTTYDELRDKVASRFFGGVSDFDAASLFRFAKDIRSNHYYESGLGD